MTFVQKAKLVAPVAQPKNLFGRAVAIDGDTLVVGAPGERNLAMPFGVNAGAAYVFTGSGGEWVLQQKLTASDADSNDRFGDVVAVSGDTVFVGATRTHPTSGRPSLYVFTRSGGVWSERQQFDVTFHPDTPSVAVAEDALVVSDRIFVRSTQSWTEQGKLDLPINVRAGALALDGNTLVVGTPNHAVTGVESGAALVYKRTGDVWVLVQTLSDPEARAGAGFGYSVAVSGPTLVVGALDRESGSITTFHAVGSDGTWLTNRFQLAEYQGFGCAVAIGSGTIVVGAYADGTPDIGPRHGSALVFEGMDDSWQLAQHLVAADAAAERAFGYSVALDGTRVVVGDPSYLSDTPGSAYIFEP